MINNLICRNLIRRALFKNVEVLTGFRASRGIKTAGKPSQKDDRVINRVAGTNFVKSSSIMRSPTPQQSPVSSCASCGVELQLSDSSAPGYYRPPHIKSTTFKKDTDNPLVLAREKILVEKFQKLDDGLELKPVDKKLRDCRLMCHKCLDTFYRSDFSLDKQSFVSVDQVMAEIPKEANVVHVISALDFPLSVSKTVSKGRDMQKVWYIVTKADAFFAAKTGLERTGLHYFGDTLAQLVGVDPSHVFLVSGKLGWNTEDILHKLPASEVYFVGAINSGKSTLIRTLIYRDNKNLRSFDQYGPGISEIPGFTANHIRFRMKQSNAILVDTPGFSPADRGVYRYLLKDDVKSVAKVADYASATIKGHSLHSPMVKGRKIFSGESLYSVGGLFYLKPPKDSIIKVFTGLPGVEAKYKDVSRALELSEMRPVAIGHRFLVNSSAALNLVRYVIPPFYGSIDLVFRNVGYLTVALCGSIDNSKLFEIYVPKEIEVIARESIFNYIYKTKSAKDETGNLLARKNVAKRGKIILRHIPKNKLIFTKLYKVPVDASTEQAVEAVVPETIFTGEQHKCCSQAEFPNTFWRLPDLV
ncbi:hypothetical protein FOA43_002271 [Brettanomyces nanus]|uniref:Genetic interactor of prohibitins 3, mitochondrial n=1 Tax=Eeniella nana TaxID=13502 RepID=A0A875S1Y5_EENNA|nr:uncharacterized protein FOA43_002271 [Brettanomyces nanus]QPG74933.1 hypothetical protein FOA43_002271 [Brettanomyces nanus]